MFATHAIAADPELERLEREYQALEEQADLPDCTDAQLVSTGISERNFPPVSWTEFEALRKSNQRLAGICRAQEMVQYLAIFARLSADAWRGAESLDTQTSPCSGRQLKEALEQRNGGTDLDNLSPRVFREIASTAQSLGQSCGLPREVRVIAVAVPVMSDAEIEAFFGAAAQDYSVRARVTEGLALASAAKTATSEYFAAMGRLAASNDEAGLAPPAEISGEQVKRVTVLAGSRIEITFRGGQIDGQTVVWRPTVADGVIQWACDEGTLPDKYRPSSCRRKQ
ncbi:MAG: pilin [Gammaproteobacteria bacterium]